MPKTVGITRKTRVGQDHTEKVGNPLLSLSLAKGQNNISSVSGGISQGTAGGESLGISRTTDRHRETGTPT